MHGPINLRILSVKGTQSVTKVKVTLEQATKAQRGSSYSSTPSLTSALDGVGGKRHAPAAFPPVPIV